MMILYPRYSKNGHLFSRRHYENSLLSAYFPQALRKYYRNHLPSLSETDALTVAMLALEAFEEPTYFRALEWDRLVEDESIPSSWTEEAARRLAEDFIVIEYPLLEPPDWLNNDKKPASKSHDSTYGLLDFFLGL